MKSLLFIILLITISYSVEVAEKASSSSPSMLVDQLGTR